MKVITYKKPPEIVNHPETKLLNTIGVVHGKHHVSLSFEKDRVSVELFQIYNEDGDMEPVDNLVVTVKPSGEVILRNPSLTKK